MQAGRGYRYSADSNCLQFRLTVALVGKAAAALSVSKLPKCISVSHSNFILSNSATFVAVFCYSVSVQNYLDVYK